MQPTTKMETKARTRKTIRAGMELGKSPTEERSDNLAQLMLDYYRASLEANAASRKAEKARKSLYKQMKDARIERKVIEAALAEGEPPVKLEAVVAAPKRDKVLVDRLIKLVDNDTFLQIVSATKTAVDKFAGTAVTARCCEEVQGEEIVTVSLAKE